jgi:AcrR family transcriptional regulator
MTASGRAPRPRAKRGEGDRLRDEILGAASELLLKTGSDDAVSIRAVADAVGVTPPSIYLHFADKDELLLAVCELQFQRFDEFVEAAVVVGATDPLSQLLRRGAAYVRFGIEHPEHYRILFMSRPGSLTAVGMPSRLRAVSGFDHLVDNVAACIGAGFMSPDQDPLVAATGLWVMVHGVTSLAISVPGFPEVGIERLMNHLAEVYTKGLAP